MTHIRGGKIPTEHVPSAVAICYLSHPICSGTLISKEWVLTASHCLEDMEKNDLKILAGATNLLEATTIPVKDIVRHERYRIERDTQNSMMLTSIEYDIALLKLDTTEVGSFKKMSPAMLPPPAVDMEGKVFNVGGWGARTAVGSGSGPSIYYHLIENVPVLSKESCFKTISSGLFQPFQMFCAGTEVKTTCPGDSGAAALYSSFEYPVVIGIVSYGLQDCRGAGVFTKVSQHLGWIFKKTGIRYLN